MRTAEDERADLLVYLASVLERQVSHGHPPEVYRLIVTMGCVATGAHVDSASFYGRDVVDRVLARFGGNGLSDASASEVRAIKAAAS